MEKEKDENIWNTKIFFGGGEKKVWSGPEKCITSE